MRKRRSYETGHRPKLLVVVDETPEADRALYFATRRAARVGAGLITLHVIPAGENQVWLGVEDIMRAEAEEKALNFHGEFTSPCPVTNNGGFENPRATARKAVRSKSVPGP